MNTGTFSSSVTGKAPTMQLPLVDRDLYLWQGDRILLVYNRNRLENVVFLFNSKM